VVFAVIFFVLAPVLGLYCQVLRSETAFLAQSRRFCHTNRSLTRTFVFGISALQLHFTTIFGGMQGFFVKNEIFLGPAGDLGAVLGGYSQKNRRSSAVFIIFTLCFN
jgi:hypothetical protein